MKLAAPIAIVSALLLTACNGAILGNLLVLGVTIGIFMATLSLGRSRPEASASTDASSSQSR